MIVATKQIWIRRGDLPLKETLDGKPAIQFINLPCTSPPSVDSDRQACEGNSRDQRHDHQTDQDLEEREARIAMITGGKRFQWRGASHNLSTQALLPSTTPRRCCVGWTGQANSR